jgi:hypothetical protein
MMNSFATASRASTRNGLFRSEGLRGRDKPPASMAARPGASACACGGGCPRCQAGGGARLASEPDRAGASAQAEEQAQGDDHDIGGPDAGIADAGVPDAGVPAPSPTPSPASPPAPAAVSPTVSATTRTGPTFGNCRAFNWIVDWSTTGRSGFIVQEITNTNTITACNGSAQPSPSTPHYWEAWSVDAAGVVSGGDQWSRVARPNTTGSWAMDGSASFVSTLDPASHFSTTAVPDANGLMATTTAPGNLVNPGYGRNKSDTWDCCSGHNTHTAR